MKPWRPLDEMDNDEIKRYSHELLKRWQVAPVDDGELNAYIREVAVRMEKMGLESPVRGGNADRQK